MQGVFKSTQRLTGGSNYISGAMASSYSTKIYRYSPWLCKRVLDKSPCPNRLFTNLYRSGMTISSENQKFSMNIDTLCNTIAPTWEWWSTISSADLLGSNHEYQVWSRRRLAQCAARFSFYFRTLASCAHRRPITKAVSISCNYRACAMQIS